jgi:sulfur carrier protein
VSSGGARALVQVRINGEERAVAVGSSVAALLDELGLDERTVAVEMDGAIVPRGARRTTPIGDGARLEIVRFVQGG